MSIALGMVVGSSLMPGAAPAWAASVGRSAEPVADVGELMAQAEQHRGAGEHAKAARSYAAAYGTLSVEERRELLGEIALDNALADYRAAYEREPEELALLEEPIALLETVVQERAKAAAAGEAVPVPVRLVDELERLRAQLRDATPKTEPTAVPDVEAEAQPEDGAPDELAVGLAMEELEPKQPANRTVDAAILASGLAGVVGGVALIGGGAWNFSTTDRRGDARLTALEQEEGFTDAQRDEYRAELARWQQQWRGTATGLVVAGSVLAAAGIGLTAWGAVRMKRHGRPDARASLGVPLVSRERLGLGVRVEF